MRCCAALLAIALAIVPSLAHSQLCMGSPSFREGRYRISGTSAFNEAAQSFTGAFAVGGRGLFGEAGVGTVRFDGIAGAGLDISASAGSQFALGRRGTVQVCPIAGVSYLMGPNDIDVNGDGTAVLDLAETDVSFGVAVGALASRSGDLQVIPTASIAFANATLKVTDQVSNTSNSDSETFGIVGVGLGFTFSKTIGLHAGVSVPLGLEGAKPSYGLSISINFGRKARAVGE
jgi:hypothetical protein